MKSIIIYLVKVWATTAAIGPILLIIKELIKKKMLEDVGVIIFMYITYAAFAFLFSIPFLLAGIFIVWILAKMNLNTFVIKVILSVLTIPACYYPLKVIAYGDQKNVDFSSALFMDYSIFFIILAILAIVIYPLHID